MLLIIAYGNTLRGDDGAGIVLGEQLEQECCRRAIATELLVCHQLSPELVIEMIRPGIESVVFTDTRIAAPDGAGSAIDIESLLPRVDHHAGGHHLCPQTLLLLAEKLYGKCIPAWQITVPGIAFDHGEGFSPITRQALDRVPVLLRGFLDRLYGSDRERSQ